MSSAGHGRQINFTSAVFAPSIDTVLALTTARMIRTLKSRNAESALDSEKKRRQRKALRVLCSKIVKREEAKEM